MSFLDLVRRRVSARGYKSTPIDDAALNQVLEAGRLAPSAANRQPWHFVVVLDPTVRGALNKAYPKDWFAEAPVVIVVCTSPGSAWCRKDGKNYADVDGAIAMDHMTLCATDLGLGTCWIGAFDPAKVREALDLPDDVGPLAMTPLGVPAVGGRPKDRKTPDEVIRRDQW